MKNMAGQKINRFREKLHQTSKRKHFDGVIRYFKKHPDEFKKYKPKNLDSSKNMAGQKIIRFRAKIHNANDRKHFDALIKYLQKHLEEFQKYKPPSRITISSSEQTIVSSDASATSTNSVDSTDNLSSEKILSSSLLALEPPKKVQRVEKISDDTDQYRYTRMNSINNFAGKHLMRVGTDKLRQSLIKQYLNGDFETITVNDFQDEQFQKLHGSMGEEAQFRAKQMFDNGFYVYKPWVNGKKSEEKCKIRTNGLVLSLDLKLQLKVTSPAAQKHLLNIDICTFNTEELQVNENGDYCHWNASWVPQVTCQKSKRLALKTLDDNSTVRI